MASLGLQFVCAALRCNCRISRANSQLARVPWHFSQPSRAASEYVPAYIGFQVEPRAIKEGEEVITHPLVYNGPDPAPYFMDHRVQSLLKLLTGYNHDKVFRHRKIQSIEAPSHMFLTDDQLRAAQEKASRKAAWLLHMPPVMLVANNETVVLSYDPALRGVNENRLVFTDISLGVSDRKRLIVVRETDGTLRHASLEERHRMNQIYNPRKGRTLKLPEIFTKDFFKDVLEREEYEFVLDKACLQMEPDEPVYQSATALTYEAVDEKQHYDTLRSTRHYGPLVFYLVWHRRCDNIIEHLLKSDRVEDAGGVVQLLMLLHPQCKTAAAADGVTDPLQLVKTYLAEDCTGDSRSRVELAVKVYQELQRSKQEYEDSVRQAHGHVTQH